MSRAGRGMRQNPPGLAETTGLLTPPRARRILPPWPSPPSSETPCRARRLRCIRGPGAIGLTHCRLPLRPGKPEYPRRNGKECSGPPPPIRREVRPAAPMAALRRKRESGPGAIPRAARHGAKAKPAAAGLLPALPPRPAGGGVSHHVIVRLPDGRLAVADYREPVVRAMREINRWAMGGRKGPMPPDAAAAVAAWLDKHGDEVKQCAGGKCAHG